MKKRRVLIAVVIPFAVWVGLFLIAPLVVMVTDSFKNDGGAWTMEHYRTAVLNKYYALSIYNSLKIALYSSVIGLAISAVSAYSISRLSQQIRDRFIHLINMTSNFAGVPLAFAFIILLGNNGVLSVLLKQFNGSLAQSFDLYTTTGLLLVYIYFQVPLGIILLYPAYDAIRPEWKEAAYMLKASKIDFWKHIGIPLMLPSLLDTFSILFANALGAYATAIALSGGNFNLLALRIGALVSGDISLNPELACALAVILGLMLLFIKTVSGMFSKSRRWNAS